MMIMKRMNMSPEEISNIQKGCKRPGIGGVKKGTIPWNKGKTNTYFATKELKEIRSKNSIGENNPKSKLSEKQVIEIIELYLQKPEIESVGKIQKNGRSISYEWGFSMEFSEKYGLTSTAIMRLITKKCWKNVWKKFEI